MSHKTKLTVASSAILDVFLDESVPQTEVNDSLIELREEIDLKIAEIQAKCLRGSSQEGK